jgi:translocation and assembly module TamB
MPAGDPERPEPRRRRRPGRLRRWLLRPLAWLLLLLVVAVSGALWYLYRPAVQRRLLERFIPRVEEYLGREVRVGQVRYSLYPMWIELRDVSIGGPLPADPPILTARVVFVLADIEGLRRPILRLEDVRAEGVDVYVHRFADGTDNWPRRRRGTGPPRDRPYELDITSLTVTDGVLRFADDAVRVGLDARHIRVGLLGMEEADLQGRVVAESVELRLPNARPYRAAVAAKVNVHREGLEILDARVSAEDAAVEGTGLVRWRAPRRVELKVAGEVDTRLFEQLGYVEAEQVAGRFDVDGTFEWTTGVWGFRGEARSRRLRALHWDVTDVAASVVGDRNAVWADIDSGAYGGGTVRGWVEVTLPGSRRPGADGRRRTRLQLRLAGIDAEAFLLDSDIPVGDLASRIAGTLDYRFVETDWRHGSGVADLRLSADPRGGGGPPFAGPLSLVIDRGVVEAQGVRLTAPGQVLTGGARYGFAADHGSIDYRVASTDLGPLSRAIPTRPADDGGAPLWLPTEGSGELSGTLRLAPGAVRTELRLALADAVARGLAADRAEGVVVLSGDAVERLDLALEREGAAALIGGVIPFDEGPPWSVAIDAAGWPIEDARPWLDFDLPVAGPFTGMVTLGGEGESATGGVSGEVGPGARLYELPLSTIRTRLAWDDRALRVEQLTLRAPAGEVSAAGEMALPGHELSLTVAASGLDPAREPLSDLLGGEVRGALSFAGEIAGTLEQPAVRGELVGERLRLADQALGADGRAVLGVDWSGGVLRADGSLLGLARLSGGGPLDLERADLTFQVEVGDLAPLAAFAPADLPPATGRAAGELRLTGPLEAPELALRVDQLAAEVGGTPLVAGAPLRLRIADGSLRLESVYLRGADGESEVIAAGSVGLDGDQPLDLRLQGVVDNRWLAGVVPWFELTGLTDVLATVRGTVSAPRVNGQAEVRHGARLTSEALPAPIDDVRAVLLFYPDRLVVDQLVGTMGDGEVQASGNLDWPRPDEPTDARFQIAARDVSLRWPEGWLMRGDGDLVWSVEGEQQQLRGLVTLDQGLYLRDVEIGVVQLLQRFFRRQREEVGVADEDLADVQLNLQVRAPGTLRIRNNLADVRASAELTVRGSLARPLLFGEVEAEPGGSLVYSDNTYRIERGTLSFANPYRVEPLLDLVATSRVANYDVRLSLVGNLERLQASFSSDPPLPELEVLSLLLSGSPTRLGEELAQLDPEAGGASETSAAEGLLLGQAASLVTQRVSNLFGFDAFRIEPLSRSGESVSSARVTVGKRLSSSVYLTYSYDPSSTGGQRFQVEWQVAEGLLVLLTQEQDSYALDMLWERRF